MEKRMHLSIVSSDGIKLDQMVDYVRIPAEHGAVGILSNHMPMLCSIKEGKLEYRMGQNQTGSFIVKDGIASVCKNEISLLVSYAKKC